METEEKKYNSIPAEILSQCEWLIHRHYSQHIEDFNKFCLYASENRDTELYPLMNNTGNVIMDLIIDLENNYTYFYGKEKLIPDAFASPYELYKHVKFFKKLIEKGKTYIEKTIDPEGGPFIIIEFSQVVYEFDKFFNYIDSLLESAAVYAPYQQLKVDLAKRNIDKFVKDLKTIFAAIPYGIYKEKYNESHFHASFLTILILLGFEIYGEDMTYNGRIDASIILPNQIYIIEAKLGNNVNNSEVAIKQIKEKDYALKYRDKNIEIIGIGISFDSKSKNINGFKSEILFRP